MMVVNSRTTGVPDARQLTLQDAFGPRYKYTIVDTRVCRLDPCWPANSYKITNIVYKKALTDLRKGRQYTIHLSPVSTTRVDGPS